MQPLNAIDAIAPAFTRTHDLLFRPFHPARSWKLAAVSYLAFAGNFFFPFPLFLLLPLVLHTGSRTSNSVLVVLGTTLTLLYFVLFYCFIRLQLVDFEMVVTLTKTIAPMWRKYTAKVWPWLFLKALVSVSAITLMTPLIISRVKDFAAIAAQWPQQGTSPDPAALLPFFASMFSFYTVLLLLFLVPKTLTTLLDDFVLPFFLLGDLSLLLAFRRGLAVIVADPLNAIAYLFMKLVLSIFGYLMQTIALQICMIPVVLVIGLAGLLGGLVFRHPGPAAYLLMIAGAIALALIAIAVIFYLSIGVFGYLLLLLDSYAIYFLAGRYPLLGNLLEPGPGYFFTPPPVFPSPDESDDDDGGPPMPMNPAVA